MLLKHTRDSEVPLPRRAAGYACPKLWRHVWTRGMQHTAPSRAVCGRHIGGMNKSFLMIKKDFSDTYSSSARPAAKLPVCSTSVQGSSNHVAMMWGCHGPWKPSSQRSECLPYHKFGSHETSTFLHIYEKRRIPFADDVGSNVCGVSAARAPSKYDGGATAAQHHHGDIWVVHNRKNESLR